MHNVIENAEETLRSGELGAIICPVCDRFAPTELFAIAALPEGLQSIITANAAATPATEVCGRCIELFNRAQRQIESHSLVFEQNDFVLPTPLRMDADERFTGRGVTVAFLDSGFYAHPDLTKPTHRILAYHSIFAEEGDQTSLETNDVASWHGMMTSVVAAGNGGLAGGLAHHQEHEIRIVNISAGGDFDESYLTNSLSQTVERCVREGLTVVCAVGNAGHIPGHPVLPPASAPSCIAVGGLDDQNSTDRARRGMYRSSYGPTIDGLQKPELIAPGIWVAAPILPRTPTAEEAELYSKLDAASDSELLTMIEQNSDVDRDLYEARSLRISLLRQLITIKLREGNVINQYYKYVDGTSFAAPIVSSIIACMLEANPRLSPQQIKHILVDTAERVPGIEVDRQGWGVVSARQAVEQAALQNRER